MKKTFLHYFKLCKYDLLDTIYLLEERKKLRIEGFKGNPNNSDEVFSYEDMCDNEPVSKQTNEDGTVTYFYSDGNEATTAKYVLNSVFPDKKKYENVCKIMQRTNK